MSVQKLIKMIDGAVDYRVNEALKKKGIKMAMYKGDCVELYGRTYPVIYNKSVRLITGQMVPVMIDDSGTRAVII